MPLYQKLLQQLNLPPLTYLGEGMQCQVFADGSDKVVKIYSAAVGESNLIRLMDFYQSLDTHLVSFNTPSIIDLERKMDRLIVTEKRLTGITPTLDYLQHLTTSELEIYFLHYVDVLFQIQNISTDFLQPGELLDQSGDFCQYGQYGSWQTLLTTNLQRKLRISKGRYVPFVVGLDGLIDQVYAHINALPETNNCLIHGDYYPANTMMDESFNISAVLDFGTFTMLGDPIYDIALGWIFADMYHNVQHFPVKDFVGDLICQRISAEEYRRMKLYILIYSILSADMYGSADVYDGHFQWAMDNLNDESLWEAL